MKETEKETNDTRICGRKGKDTKRQKETEKDKQRKEERVRRSERERAPGDKVFKLHHPGLKPLIITRLSSISRL